MNKAYKIIYLLIILQNIYYVFQEIFTGKNKYGYTIHNGAPVSKVQLKLASLLKVSKEHINYNIGPYYGDIVYPDEHIVIEYDGYYWHKNKDDSKRTQYLINNGWRVIKIKSNSKLPSIAVLKQKINIAKKGKTYQEIILDDWNNNG